MNTSVWDEDRPRARLEPPPRSLPRAVDVLVVGAGITGLAVAHRLAGSRSRVLVAERASAGAGASGRNAGFLLAGVAANYAAAVRNLGRPLATEVWRFTLDNHLLLADALRSAGAVYRRRGSWTLPASLDEATELREAAALLSEDGLPGEWRDRAPASGGGPPGGLLNPADGEVDPVGVLRVLASRLPPGALAEGLAVSGLEPGGGGVRVHLDSGEVEAGRVVIATNGYARRLLPALPVAPVRAQMLATAPYAGTLADRPVYSDFGYRYWRQLDDGRVLLGGFRNTAFAEEIGDDDNPTAALQERLDGHLRALGVTAPVTHRWAGTMGFTPDELPLVGPVPGHDNVFFCGGYSGHGLGFAAHAAKVLVDSWSGGAIPGWLDIRRAGAARRADA